MHSIDAMSNLFQAASGSPPPSPLSSPKASQHRSSRSSFDLNDDDVKSGGGGEEEESGRGSVGSMDSITSSPTTKTSGRERADSSSSFPSSPATVTKSSSSSSSSNLRLAEQLDETKRQLDVMEEEKRTLVEKLNLCENRLLENERSSRKSEVDGDTSRQAQLKAEKERDLTTAHVRDLEEKMETLAEELSSLRTKTSETERMLSSQLRQQADELEVSSPGS
jgi:hypothetical protein